MPAKLYTLPMSHPGDAARAMVEHKGLEHEVVNLLAGFHPIQLRLAGFRGGTVPPLVLEDGRKVEKSRAIARALDEVVPDPPLFPAEPARRRAVEEAERWGDEVFQDVPRRLFRWGTVHRPALRRRLAEQAKIPAPGLAAAMGGPQARWFARQSRSSDENVRATIASIPEMLDRVDALIAEQTIGGEQPNAADFQIASTVRSVMNQQDLRPAVEGRPAAALAARLFPREGEVPPYLPAEWLAPLRAT